MEEQTTRSVQVEICHSHGGWASHKCPSRAYYQERGAPPSPRPCAAACSRGVERLGRRVDVVTRDACGGAPRRQAWLVAVVSESGHIMARPWSFAGRGERLSGTRGSRMVGMMLRGRFRRLDTRAAGMRRAGWNEAARAGQAARARLQPPHQRARQRWATPARVGRRGGRRAALRRAKASPGAPLRSPE